MKRIVCLFMSLVMMMSIVFGLDLTAYAAASSYDFNVSGDCDYTMANDILKYTNQERAKTGAAPLVMDEELLEAAMTRAMELTLYFSHTRPDGSSCDTVSSKLYGENIIADYGTADYAVELWMDSAGHKANILNTNFKSVGIGCFKAGDTYYAVQCFGTADATEVANKSGVVRKNEKIAVKAQYVNLTGSLWYDSRYIRQEPYMCPNETGSFNCGFNNGTSSYGVRANSENCTFVSSNPDVVSIDANGKLYSHKVGTAEVTVTFKQNSAMRVTKEVEVKTLPFNEDEFTIYGFSSRYAYTGNPIKPSVTIQKGYSLLTEGKDYTVTYKNNVNIGTASIIIKFIREYDATVTKTFIIACEEHKRTEERNGKKATCTEDGYFSDTYCKDCGVLIAKGYKISKTGHRNKEVRNAKTATCIQTGYTGDTYCKDCGVLISKGSTIAKDSSKHRTKSETKVTPATGQRDGSITEQKICQDCGKIVSNKTTEIAKIKTVELQKTTIGYNWYYTGKQITPTVTVKDSTGKALVRGTDYSLTYDSGRVNIGKYAIKVTFKGNYSGTKTLEFNIVQKPAKDQWLKSGNRWWYRHADGSYTKNGWEKISGKWYHFDKSGWMQTGWLKLSGKWYYLNSSGVMATGWTKVSNKWYYMNGSGVMQTGWIKLSNKWYYLNSSGAMLTGRQKIGNKWYTFNSSGVWIK